MDINDVADWDKSPSTIKLSSQKRISYGFPMPMTCFYLGKKAQQQQCK